MSIIEVKNLVKEFEKGEVKAVKGISFEVKEGETLAFLGPNGAGKTTTIKMLTTLLQPTSGSITLNGFDAVTHPDSVRHAFGIVFQDPSLDTDMTAYENMELHGVLYGIPKEVRQKRIKDLLELIELADRKDDFVRNFSGGMKRRLEIARGLMHHPKVLFLDEPTVGLDPQTRNHIWGYIKELNKLEKITVFFTTHHMEEAEKAASRIVVVDHGSIIADGTLAELKAKTGTQTLEEAFLKLTGSEIRAQGNDAKEDMRMGMRAWGRK
jgi:ABC-2 type transport system ATP-binding protein